MEKQYVHYGCALTAPKEWINFDVSPTLRIQKIPIIGKLLKKRLNINFPSNVRYGNIIKGLPIRNNSCDGVYCSHTLEDFRKAIRNSYQILKEGGTFRCVVPDLEQAARSYITKLDDGDINASLGFFDNTLLGWKTRPKDLKGILRRFVGNSNHLWMWDQYSLSEELKNVGFREVRFCEFNDCEDEMFKLVEDHSRFINAVAIECKK
ncbi:class I SAM-dependent methyltransferase [Candidatus Nitrosacidococcus tergens]|uniref:Methyltransferase type 11 n=1 Tax=Candidatus Nitrosacidococcus tergens TaxID=553981 RepID=A0A7G1Q7Q5_9GAMM|nr:methyltransferase domain-containing protein [Candidatus Nitrosacidococcus tergens]CAB1274468.1 Methyltransferase type 11 [Candidatus Nitrosacidococcus tergens]